MDAFIYDVDLDGVTNTHTSVLEAIATGILRCFHKNALEELYLVNLLHLKKPVVGLWKKKGS